MKAKELMLGNWVKQKDSPYKFQVRSIREGWVQGVPDEGQFREDKIEPIPLTESILLKNGLKRIVTSSDWYPSAHYYYMRKLVWTCCLDTNSKLGYVHQIQQELLRSGFEELADNFKVE